jgi:hypothetical protein
VGKGGCAVSIAINRADIYSAVDLSKRLVFEEIFHSSQKDVHPKPSFLGAQAPDPNDVSLYLCNTAYAEVEAKVEAALFANSKETVTPKGKKYSKESIKKALKTLCDCLAHVQGQLTPAQTSSKRIFDKCKSRGQSYLATPGN